MELADLAYDGNYVAEVIRPIKSGKEATVFCCRVEPHSGFELVAAKVYRPLESRSFRNDAVYQRGRYIGDARLRRAYAKKSKAGKSVQYGNWISAEYETMRLLFDAGARVPKPLSMTSSTIVMEYIGTEEEPAQMLSRLHLDPTSAPTVFHEIVSNIELFLANGRVHADLSPFNVLYWDGDIRIIDFPQAVDPFTNIDAFGLLLRDVENVCTHFGRYGLHEDAYEVASRIWRANETVNTLNRFV